VEPRYSGDYGYDCASPLLFNLGGLLQVVVSQAGTHYFSGKFHNQGCGIYKSEGGCNIAGTGELVLRDHSCYFDSRGRDDGKAKDMAALITKIVLEWEPLDPVNSMISSAAAFIQVPIEKLRTVLEAARSGGVFGGNALADFFRWNPFSEPPIQEEYEHYCWVQIWKRDPKEIEQIQSDRALGRSLLERLDQALATAHKGDELPPHAYCCSPQRGPSGLRFWINTGRMTQIDGWKAQAEIESFIASGEKLSCR